VVSLAAVGYRIYNTYKEYIHTNSMHVKKNKKVEQSEVTRGVLLRVARELFTDKGYAATATEDIVQRAGVTRGALYHHFRDKAELFQAVFEDVERELVETVRAAGGGALTDPWDGLFVGCQAFLDACLEPTVQRIVLLDAPSVLGWETWRRIDAEYGVGLIRQSVQAAMDAGDIDRLPVDPLAHIVLGALNEAALLIARAEHRTAARAEAGVVVDRFLKGLRTSPADRRQKNKSSTRAVK
jgi:AcrR family transcriptional regulator